MLVVDDSVVMRRIVSETLGADPSIEIVGTAATGSIALARIQSLNPDVVTLDLEMPEMDGLQTLRAIRVSHPRLPVIIFSTLSQRGATKTLDALALGANDYVAKPTANASSDQVIERIREELTRKVKGLGGIVAPRSVRSPVQRPVPLQDGLASRVDVVAIGTSTGGPNALDVVLTQLPKDFPVPVLVVQHMPPQFTKILAERLASRCKVGVFEAANGMPITAGNVYIAPGDFHLEVVGRGGLVQARTTQGEPENSCRPAVDVLFRSVARAFGGRALGVVLTGMGKDGWRGSEELSQAGSKVIVQDEATSVVWGMPAFVAEAGIAEEVLPVEQIASSILRRVRKGAR